MRRSPLIRPTLFLAGVALLIAACGPLADAIGPATVVHAPAGSIRRGRAAVAARHALPTPTDVSTTTAEPASDAAETGIAPTPGALAPGLVTHGERERRLVALTFDACETPTVPAGYDKALIAVLATTRTPATLFLGGHWMFTHPAETRDLAANPLFELGSHSWSHADFAKLSQDQIEEELRKTDNQMLALTGRTPTIFRFPYGSYSPTALAAVAQHGERAIEWDVVTGDPDRHVSAARMLATVSARVRNGSIIVMHMNGRGWHTAAALPSMIKRLRAEGYTFVTVSELLGRQSPLPSGAARTTP